MAKSSYAVALLFAGWAAEAAAAPPPSGPVTAEEAMQHYRETFGVVAPSHCAESGTSTDEDIVVCGRAHAQPYRLPLPIEREPGEIVRHVGEPVSAVEAMTPPCPSTCGAPVKFNVIELLFKAPKVVRHILHGDD
jgi:hypothetical protein